MFRVYARELLDLIKYNLDKNLQRKYRIFKDKKCQEKRLAKRVARSKSPPSPSFYAFVGDLGKNLKYAAKNNRKIKTPSPTRGKQSRLKTTYTKDTMTMTTTSRFGF